MKGYDVQILEKQPMWKYSNDKTAKKKRDRL